MEQRIIELKNWIMFVRKDKLVLSGIADEHPKLGRNVELASTSAILSIEENRSFIMTCRTMNSVYKLDWRYANLTPREYLASPTTLVCAETVRDKYILYIKLIKARDRDINELNPAMQTYMKLIAEGKKQFDKLCELNNKNLINNALKYKNCIYLELSSISKGSPIAFNTEGKTGIINPSGNGGYYVDSVEYRTDDKSDIEVLFGYFVGHDCMDIHSVSKNIENIVIHNNKKADIIVNGSYKVRFNETILIESASIRG